LDEFAVEGLDESPFFVVEVALTIEELLSNLYL